MITNLGVSSYLGTCPGAVWITWGDQCKEDCDLDFLHTLLPAWDHHPPRADKQHTTELSSTRDQNEYKRGETRTFPQSPLSHHQQRSLRHVAVFLPRWSDGIEDLKLTRGWRITLYRGWTPPCEWREGGTTEDYRRHHTQRHNQGSNTWVVSRHNIPSWTPWGQGITLYWGPVGHYK